MANYIDGFVLPIPEHCLDEYKRVVEGAAKVWIEHGALDYREFIGDDLTLAGSRSFIDGVKAAKDEVVVFGWVEFASKQARDLANEKVAADPRMAELLATSRSGFDAQRMLYGGFTLFACAINGKDEQ